MTGGYSGYQYKVAYQQRPDGAWYAEISITRPDGTPLGPYGPTAQGARSDLNLVQSEARSFICSKVDQDVKIKNSNGLPHS